MTAFRVELTCHEVVGVLTLTWWVPRLESDPLELKRGELPAARSGARWALVGVTVKHGRGPDMITDGNRRAPDTMTGRDELEAEAAGTEFHFRYEFRCPECGNNVPALHRKLSTIGESLARHGVPSMDLDTLRNTLSFV